MRKGDIPRSEVRRTVQDAYACIAEGGQEGCCGSRSSCCGAPKHEELAQLLGYSDEDIAALPEDANMGLSCGNPTAHASVKPGQVVLDLGSGGGFDVFITARKVGPSGSVIGVDMTPEMIHRARKNVASFRDHTGLDNVEFRLGEIEHLPVPDASVDMVISNCVINLSSDKPQVWREIARVLKPGGRVAVSDIALLRPLPEEARASVKALVGCVGGAVLVDKTREMVRAAGLAESVLETRSDYIEHLSTSSDPLYSEIAAKLPPGTRPADFVTSLNITAQKPRSGKDSI